jgi:polysaccharide export outer membrane protein
MLKKFLILGILLYIIGLVGFVAAQQAYRLGPEDEIEIRVWGNDDLTRRVRVGLDGTISFPFVGAVEARGLTIAELQKELEHRLGPKYLIDPRVSITILEYKSRKFFVLGRVAKPGTYPLTKPIRVVEAISLAGGLGATSGEKVGSGGGSSGMVIIIRAKPGGGAEKPRQPDQTPTAEKIVVSLSAALAGDPTQNLEINNGDTIYVPALFYYVQGQVKNPGRFPYEENMTVLMAVTTAGGFTDKAAQRRAFITREKGGKKEEVKVKLDDHIQAGDVITIPESWF